ncbi:hypothetical protein HDV03_004525 [Kappamyces sp. JEL0829]|nr:hypothetical protein HDV03_004525 [Kappamyces sp. JEL0829]
MSETTLSIPPSEPISVEDEPHKSVASTLSTALNTVNLLMGVGIISIPYGVSRLGWALGIGLLLVFSLLARYTGSLIGRIMSKTGATSMFEIAELAFGNTGKLVLGALFTLELFTASVAMLILFADSLTSLLPALRGQEAELKFMAWFLLLPFTLTSSLSKLAWMSFIGVLSLSTLIFTITFNGLNTAHGPGSLWDPQPTHWSPMSFSSSTLGIGLLFVGLDGHAVFPSLYGSMKNPREFGQSLSWSYLVVGLTYIGVGTVGYLMYGVNVSPEIILDLKGGVLTRIALTLMTLNPLTKYPLVLLPVSTSVQRFIGIEMEGDVVRRALVRIVVGGTVCMVSILVPSFIQVMGLMGSTLSFGIAAAFPLCSFLVLDGEWELCQMTVDRPMLVDEDVVDPTNEEVTPLLEGQVAVNPGGLRERWMAQALLVFVAFMMVLGTAVTPGEKSPLLVGPEVEKPRPDAPPYGPLCSFADYDQFKGDPSNSVNRFTVLYDDMPPWYVADSFLVGGYRRITQSWRGCLVSLFYLHNESGNVYTHLLGALGCAPLAYVLFSDWMAAVPTTSLGDYLSHFTYLVGLLTCLSLSTLFHLCCCHSKRVSMVTNKADYIGIVALQVGSFVPAIYYGFYCDAFYQTLYITSIVLLGLVTIYVTVGPKFASAQYRWLRTGLFTLFGALGVFPLAHHVGRYGLAMAKDSFSIDLVLLMGMFYLFGAFIYAYRIPERWLPNGTFDIFGHSHQIWHCFVLAAALSHFWGIYRTYIWWHTYNPFCSVSDAEMISWFAAGASARPSSTSKLPLLF